MFYVLLCDLVLLIIFAVSLACNSDARSGSASLVLRLGWVSGSSSPGVEGCPSVCVTRRAVT